MIKIIQGPLPIIIIIIIIKSGRELRCKQMEARKGEESEVEGD